LYFWQFVNAEKSDSNNQMNLRASDVDFSSEWF